MSSDLPRRVEPNILDALGPLAPDHRVADRLAESGTQFTNLTPAQETAPAEALATLQAIQVGPGDTGAVPPIRRGSTS